MNSYATPADLVRYAIAGEAIRGLTPDVQQKALDAASRKADGYLSGAIPTPVQPPYPEDLVEAVCNLAAYALMKVRGYNPDDDGGTLRSSAQDAIRWLKDVQQGLVNPGGTMIGADGKEPGEDGGPQVSSDPQRGWQLPPRTNGGGGGGGFGPWGED